jgi:hypothetical protein
MAVATERKTKRIVVIGDMHCGHIVGLTPPQFDPGKALGGRKVYNIRRELWDKYVVTMDDLQPIDALVVNGDAIDGQGMRSGGTEQITTDRLKQAEIASVCIRQARAKQHFFAYGTGYHVGDAEDFESTMTKAFNATAEDVVRLDVNGLKFNFKHHVGNSSLPHTRLTPVMKELMWNLFEFVAGEAPRADILCRSHVHYHGAAYFPIKDRMAVAMTLPALQAAGSKYGGRRCSGLLHFGAVAFDVEPDGSYSWQPHLFRIKAQFPTEHRL